MTDTIDAQLVATHDLVAALGALTDPRKDGQVTAGQRRYRYLELPDLLHEVRTVFAAHHWAIMQQTSVGDHQVTVVNVWLHASGVKLTHPPYTLPAGRSPQEIGSATTYARRYSLASLVGLAGSDDDDAQLAQQTVAVERPITRAKASPNDPINAPWQTPPQRPPVMDSETVTWAKEGESPQDFKQRTSKATDKQIKYLWTLLRGIGDDAEIRAWVAEQLHIEPEWHTNDLNMRQVSQLIELLKQDENP